MPAEHYGFPTIHEVMREASESLSKPTDVPCAFHEAKKNSDEFFLFEVKLKHDFYRRFIGTVDELAENKLYFASSLTDDRVKELLERIDANTAVSERVVSVSLSIQDMYDLQRVIGEYQMLVTSRSPMLRNEYNKFEKTINEAFNRATDTHKKKPMKSILRATKKLFTHRIEL